ncbi:hypothetical protein BO83DRAFT_454901 [Aspergillus eucalypticola CBS 122712]|uniref:Uncharacterized protein n=1 Tax=Aspergillus eucalypticola (strain CBS 122712 / IBT 29274) TaxID=1448314 RepID=A0A317W9G9_ASPEC|nr:uncharacterized protein BO83DRAFT_454901 [Aspergillus eucalypticola CBS 122712]PWY82799.1 hypothetical protein BO83DRAFT_454901 [Aspergillus eucalypticola CBS 122712]
MPDLPRKLPKNAQEWEDAIDEMELTGKTVHGAELASASRIEYKQFLLLRVLWVGHHATDLPKMLPGFNRWIAKAEKMLKVLNIEELRIHDPLDDSETLRSQRLRAPSRTPESQKPDNVLYPPTMDEQIVNCALFIFLNALTMPFKLANNWTLHRKAFKAKFYNASFEARTDGYLDDRRGEAQAIIEVKPVR